MKKVMALIALLFIANAVQATLVLDESFDYMIGETLDEKGGWSTSNGRKLEITNESLKYAKLLTRGQKISIDCDINANPGLYKKTFTPIELKEAGDAIYFSFLIYVRNTGSDNASIKIDLGAASFVTTSNDNSPRGIYPRLTANGPTVRLPDGIHLIIGKFLRDTFDNEYGQVFLWVDPDKTSLGKVEDGEANSKTKNIYQGSGTWAISTLSINLNGYFSTGSPRNFAADVDFDEFRVGTSWAEVTPVPVKKSRKILGLGTLILVLACVSKKKR